MIEEKSLEFESLVHGRYFYRPGPGRLFILLHGYMYSGQTMMNWLAHHLPEDSAILAPNAPYPIPVKEKDRYRIGYSWYFFDNLKDEYFIGYEICKSYINNLCEQLALSQRPTTLIGYSQGGYASVHMLEALPQVDHLVGVGCQYVIDKPHWNRKLRIDSLHAEKDEMVDMKRAQKLFSQIPESFRGDFTVISDEVHKPSGQMLKQVVDIATR